MRSLNGKVVRVTHLCRVIWFPKLSDLDRWISEPLSWGLDCDYKITLGR